jgi:quercetin dioxygenase-like cupin family protein
MIVKRPQEVTAVPVQVDGAKDVKVRVVFGPQDKAPTFAMRIFELAPGGHTPLHEHPFEHEILILEGRIGAVGPQGVRPVDVGDMLLVMPGETHQFKNLSSTQLARMMCLVPVAYQK